MKKSYHSSAEPTAEASITRASDDLSRAAVAALPVVSVVMVALPALLVVALGAMLDQRRRIRQAAGTNGCDACRRPGNRRSCCDHHATCAFGRRKRTANGGSQVAAAGVCCRPAAARKNAFGWPVGEELMKRWRPITFARLAAWAALLSFVAPGAQNAEAAETLNVCHGGHPIMEASIKILDKWAKKFDVNLTSTTVAYA